jgi:hypothetical protein
MADIEELAREIQTLKSLVASRSGTEQDPSALTVARIDHEIGNLRELLTAKDGANDARLAAMDKAVMLLEKFPTAIDVAVGNLKELHQEKFEGVGVRFQELNTRLTEGDRYKQTALDAALKSAETLVSKQQDNNEKSIKKTEELFTKQLDALKETIDDMKGSSKKGVDSAIGWLFGAIAAVYATAATVALIVRH